MSKILSRLAATVLLAGLSGSAYAQAFTEGFDDISSLTTNGWFIQNNSTPVGTTTWFQGTPTTATPSPGPFNAYTGAANSYIAANFNSTGSTGTISNWLMTPNRTFRNGDVFTFYTRKPTILAGQTDYPDRLEVRLSTNGASTNVGAGSAGLGDFTTLLLSVNPTLIVGGYPQVWTQYTITVSDLPAPTSGRLAFRYFVTSAGSLGTSSDYIGIDQVAYSPYVCPAVSVSPSTVPAANWGETYSFSLSQTGALGTPSYAVTAGGLPSGLTLTNAGTISGTPTATGGFTFTVTAFDASGCSGSQSYAMSVNAVAPSAPMNVTASAGDAQVEVTWDAPTSDGGAGGISNYSVQCGADVVTANSSPITVKGLVNGSTYTCSVIANAVGQSVAAYSNSVTPMGVQSITFGEQSGQTYREDGTFAIDPPAVASSGLDVVYASSTVAVCTVSGATVSIVAAGTCTLTADQGGDIAWNPAPQVEQSLVIAKASQVLTFPTQTQATRWFHAGTSFAIAPQASSAEPNSGASIIYSSLVPGVCTVSGVTVTMVAAGTCSIAANQAGDDNFMAAAEVTEQVMLVAPTVADLWIEKTTDKTIVAMGETVTYSILVGNDGEATALNVRVLDTPPLRLDPATVTWECLEAIGTSCPVPSSGTGTLDATIASLPKDAGLRFELRGAVTVAADPEDDYTTFHNTASVALPAGSGLTDPPGNNQSTVGVLVDIFFSDGFEELPTL